MIVTVTGVPEDVMVIVVIISLVLVSVKVVETAVFVPLLMPEVVWVVDGGIVSFPCP